jgi:hypothetical protein
MRGTVFAEAVLVLVETEGRRELRFVCGLKHSQGTIMTLRQYLSCSNTQPLTCIRKTPQPQGELANEHTTLNIVYLSKWLLRCTLPPATTKCLNSSSPSTHPARPHLLVLSQPPQRIIRPYSQSSWHHALTIGWSRSYLRPGAMEE